MKDVRRKELFGKLRNTMRRHSERQRATYKVFVWFKVFFLAEQRLSFFFFFLLLQHSLVNNLLEKLSGGGFFALGGEECQSLEYCWSIHCNVTK